MHTCYFIPFVYPGWHASDYRPGCDEWSLLEGSRKHCAIGEQIVERMPIQGRYDDRSLDVVRGQIEKAIAYGICGFQYFYYCDHNHEILNEPFHAALALSSSGKEFGVSICWCARLPHRILPIEPRSLASSFEVLFTYDQLVEKRIPFLDFDECGRLFQRWCTDYCSQDGYLRIQGRPLLSFLNLPTFSRLYGIDGFARRIQLCREIFQQLLSVDPLLIGICSGIDRANLRLGQRLPFDALSGYGLLPNWGGPHVQLYQDRIDIVRKQWSLAQFESQKWFFPVIVSGWNASARGKKIDPGDKIPTCYPWSPIVHGVSAERFGTFADHAIDFNADSTTKPNIVMIHAWNEWSEGSAIEPSRSFGERFLAEIGRRTAKTRLAPSPGLTQPTP